jgi:hypothetical protein
MSETIPEDIPDDIVAAAEAVVERGYDEGLIEAVSYALLAERLAATERERERCALIAEGACNRYGFWQDGWAVAAAIRSQP